MASVRIRKRGKTFSYAFEAGKQADGRRRVIEKGGFATREEAYEAGTAAYIDYRHGNIGITSERITVKDFLDLWLKHMKDNIRMTTFKSYGSFATHSIIPYIGSIILQDLTPAMLDKWMQELFSKGYSKGTLSEVKMVLQEALSYAVYPCQLIQSSPVTYIKVPRNAPEKIVKRTIITEEKYEEVLNGLPADSPFRLPIIILYNTGLRIGEVIGLCWEDVDFKNGTLTVRHQLITQNKKDYISPLKTKASYRTIYLTQDFLNTLADEKEAQEMNEDLLGDEYVVYNYVENGSNLITGHSAAFKSEMPRVHLVCIGKDGRLASKHSIMGYLSSHGTNSHSFRHTQATRLAEIGIPPAAVSARLGHANTSITLDLYTHSTEEQQKLIAKNLEIDDMDKFFDK